MVRVWFNHWFSTSYRLIELMKEDSSEEVYVIGSNQQVDSVIQLVCDEWYQEEALDGEEYIDFCLEFCKKHDVNVFVPRRKMVDISKNIEKFHQIGVKVMLDDYEKISILNNKATAYEFFSDCEKIKVPEYCIVNSVAAFKEAYEKLRDKYDKVCMKFVQDEGGLSFRKIVDNVDLFKRLRIYPGSEMAYSEICDILEQQGEFDDIMVMPYLPGEEISVDCLSTENGLIAVPRIKGNARHEYVKYEAEIMDMTTTVMNKIRLEYPCNVQFKIRDGVAYLLEINTRMSGGLQMSCLAAGVNIPNIALNKLLGKNIQWKQDKSEKVVSYIELPQIIR